MYSLHTPPTSPSDLFIPSRVFRPQQTINLRTCVPIKIQFQRRRRDFNFTFNVKRTSPIRTFAISQNSNESTISEDDFVTRVLKENPSQVEPKYLIGNKFFTSAEREKLTREGSDYYRVIEIIKKLKSKTVSKLKGDADRDENDVYLKDILREHKGKLYVPEQVFSDNLSEEEHFDRVIEDFPRMSLEDFEKAMKSDKIKLLIFKESGVSLIDEFRDFVVELKEIPGDKSLHRTKW